MVKENDNIRKYMQQMKVADSLTASIVFSICIEQVVMNHDFECAKIIPFDKRRKSGLAGEGR